MELQAPFSFNHVEKKDFDLIIGDNLPDECSKQVNRETMLMLSTLPLGRRQDAEQIRVGNHDDIIRDYLISILQEIAEIRSSIKDISPAFQATQKSLQNLVFTYARDHTSYSRRVRVLRSASSGQSQNSASNTFKSFCNRVWVRFLDATLPMCSPSQELKLKQERKIRETFKNFYKVNKVCFRAYMRGMTSRCRRLDILLTSLKHQLRTASVHRADSSNNCVAGLAFQLGLERGQMSRWRKDFDCVCREARSVRKIIGHLPIHNCWEAIYNLMTSQAQLNLYL